MKVERLRHRWPEKPWPPNPLPPKEDRRPDRPGYGRRDLPQFECANCRYLYESDDHPSERCCPICGHSEV